MKEKSVWREVFEDELKSYGKFLSKIPLRFPRISSKRFRILGIAGILVICIWVFYPSNNEEKRAVASKGNETPLVVKPAPPKPKPRSRSMTNLEAIFNPNREELISGGKMWSVKENFELVLKTIKITHPVGYETQGKTGYKDVEVTGNIQITLGYKPKGQVKIEESPNGQISIQGLGEFSVLHVEVLNSWVSARETKGFYSIKDHEIVSLIKKLRPSCIAKLEKTKSYMKYEYQARASLASRIKIKTSDLQILP